MRETIGVTKESSLYGLDKTIPLIRYDMDSLDEYVYLAERGIDAWRRMNSGSGYYSSDGFTPGWTGASTWGEIKGLALYGWKDRLVNAIEVAERAYQLVEMEVDSFEPQHNVQGGDVDISAYLQGVPENMIEYPMQKIAAVGTTITIACDVQCHGVVSGESVIKRGEVVVALVLALEEMGHNTELIVSDEYTDNECRVINRCKVKGANDVTDPAKIMYAFAHPSVQRGLGFVSVAGMQSPWNRIAHGGYGRVSQMTNDFPEGTLLIPPVFRDTDAPNADTELRAYLAQLGLLSMEDL